MTEQRRLAAIVSADVAGYSRLMGRDESGTLAALKVLRQEVVDPAIASHGGRIVKTTGDGLLLEFPSAVIRWALRALNDKPEMLQPRINLLNCYVGANEIAKARAVFAEAQRLAPEYTKSKLEGAWWFGRPADRKRASTFFRIAAGLEDPSAAEGLR
jgi:class 3 adenylate cyclase